MNIQPFVFDGGVLGAAAAAQGAAVPALTKRTIRAAALVNTTAGAVAATVHLVPSGAAPGVGNTLISARVLAPGETYTCPELIGQGLNEAGTVQALGAGLTFKYAATDVVGA